MFIMMDYKKKDDLIHVFFHTYKCVPFIVNFKDIFFTFLIEPDLLGIL